MTKPRQVAHGEWRLYRALRLAALRDAPYAFDSTADDEAAFPDRLWQERTERGANGEAAYGVVAGDAEHPLGLGVGLADDADAERAYLVSMWVAREARGGELATAVLDAIARWAKLRGSRILIAGVRAGNARALAFYKKAGFKAADTDLGAHAAISSCEVVLVLDLKLAPPAD